MGEVEGQAGDRVHTGHLPNWTMLEALECLDEFKKTQVI